MILRFVVLSSILFSMFIIVSIHSCKKDNPQPGTDEKLLGMAQMTSGFTWYKKTDALLSRSAGSGHAQAFLRTRYNTKAASKLDSAGKIVVGSIFPEGSLIVKELYENSSTLTRYAILYKDSTSNDADAKGWVWGYINPDGTVSEPAANKGQACNSCHSQADNIDYMLMNKYFP